jgi:hypothetical protein
VSTTAKARRAGASRSVAAIPSMAAAANTANTDDAADAAAFLAAMRPVARALGATIVSPRRMRSSDVPLEWRGQVAGALRMPDLQGELQRMIGRVERELGGRLGELSREDKQRAVKLLDERGAFTLRKSIEDVADALGVSRITVYNYLNAVGARTIGREGQP